ncbi:Crp/Fnr family transcriptional regulator [Microbispora rosea]
MCSFPRSTWRTLLAEGVLRRYQPGDVLLQQGASATHVLLLVQGHVKATRLEPDGRELLLAVRGPGDLLGELAVLGGGERSATVSALTSCLTHVISAERFYEIVRSFDLHGLLIRRAIQRLREGEAVRAELAGLPASVLVARTLIRLATGLEVRLSQSDLAAATGLSRSAVTAELATLRRAGSVVTSRRRIVIRDLGALQTAASSERPVLDGSLRR